MKFGTDVHGAQRMSPNDFGDPQVFNWHYQLVKVMTYLAKHLKDRLAHTFVQTMI